MFPLILQVSWQFSTHPIKLHAGDQPLSYNQCSTEHSTLGLWRLGGFVWFGRGLSINILFVHSFHGLIFHSIHLFIIELSIIFLAEIREQYIRIEIVVFVFGFGPVTSVEREARVAGMIRIDIKRNLLSTLLVGIMKFQWKSYRNI